MVPIGVHCLETESADQRGGRSRGMKDGDTNVAASQRTEGVGGESCLVVAIRDTGSRSSGSRLPSRGEKKLLSWLSGGHESRVSFLLAKGSDGGSDGSGWPSKDILERDSSRVILSFIRIQLMGG